MSINSSETMIGILYRQVFLKQCLLVLIILCLCISISILSSFYRQLIFVKIEPATKSNYRFDVINLTITYHESMIDEKHLDIRRIYYRSAIHERNSTYPFLSGDTLRALSHHIYDETRRDNMHDVKTGDIVFVKGDSLFSFFGRAYPRINYSFVLITHNSDCSAPSLYGKHLNDEKIIAWYASNPETGRHPKFFPLPIGFANQHWITGELRSLMYAFHHYRQPWLNRTIHFYVNFGMKSNRIERPVAFEQARRIRNSFFVYDRIGLDQYYREIGNSKFVLSPPGNGLDCHRTWEAMLMGAVPVVRSSGLDPLFSGIPAITVKNWSFLTNHLLDQYQHPLDDRFIPVVLYARYWREHIWKSRSSYVEDL